MMSALPLAITGQLPQQQIEGTSRLCLTSPSILTATEGGSHSVTAARMAWGIAVDRVQGQG